MIWSRAEVAISISYAQSHEVAEIDSLRMLSLRTLGASHYSARELNAWINCYREDLNTAVAKGDKGIFVARRFASIVGLCRVIMEERSHILSLFVHPDFTRLRIGTRLLKEAESYCYNQGQTELFVSAALNSIPFYTSNKYIMHYNFDNLIRVCDEKLPLRLVACKMSKKLG